MALNENAKGKHFTPEECHWSRHQVLALISNVEEFFDDFYDESKKKKTIWEAVAQRMQKEGHNYTGVECDKKWRNLKGTYMKVLQKRIKGETGYRFEYFDALHHILDKERTLQNNQVLSVYKKSQVNSEFQELSVDDGFVWIHYAVNYLLDQISDTFSTVVPNSTIQEKWEVISGRMTLEGHDVDKLQCQRKWENLQEGYFYHQAKFQSTGEAPQWPYFHRVKDIMIALNIPITVQVDVKTDVRVGSEKKMKSPGSNKASFRKRFADTSYHRDPSRSLLSHIRKLESKMNVSQRLDCLEERVEAAQIQRVACVQTNVLLTQIISELRKINQTIESENEYRYGNHHQRNHHIPRPVSPNQGIIIVEDIG